MNLISLIPSDAKAVLVKHDGYDAVLPGCLTPPTIRTINSKIGPLGSISNLEVNIPPLLWVLNQEVYVYYPTPSGWYNFQFDNVYYDGHICWGYNAAPHTLRRAYNLFWTAPFLDEAGIKNPYNGSVTSYHTCNKWVNMARCPATHSCANFLLPDCQCRCCSNQCYCGTDCRCCLGYCGCSQGRASNPDWVAFRKALLQDYVQTVTKLGIPQSRSRVKILGISDTAKGFSGRFFAHPVEEIDGDWALEPTPTMEGMAVGIIPRADIFLL